MDLEDLKKKYEGETAEKYEEERKKSEKWWKEQKSVKQFLNEIVKSSENLSVLDVPVGTGRFLPIYDELSIDNVVGIDASQDMLKVAADKTTNEDVGLKKGDVMKLSEYNINPDVVVCVRLLNWLDDDDMKKALRNILNSGADNVIVGIFLLTSDLICTFPRFLQKFGEKIYRVAKGKKVLNTGTIHDKKIFYEIVKNNGFEVKERNLVDEDKFSKRTFIHWLERK